MNQSHRSRTLSAETLESRQFLHGGGFGAAMGGGEPPAAEDVAAAIIERLDADDDGTIVAEETSERMWSRISVADTDGDSAITLVELTTHIESALANRQGPRLGGAIAGGFGGMRGEGCGGFRGGHGGFGGGETSVEDRVAGLYERLDANDDGLLTEDEVSERKWSRISEADTDNDEGVSADELRDYIESRHSGDGTDDGDQGEEEEPQPALASSRVVSQPFSAIRRGSSTMTLRGAMR